MTEKTINWLEPTPRRRGVRTTVPSVRVTFTPAIKDRKRPAYYRLTANKAFMKKHYDGSKDKSVAISIGRTGVIYLPSPGKEIPSFQFNKSNVINDRGLVEMIFERLKVKMNGEVKSVKLVSKPHGQQDGLTLYKLLVEKSA